MAGAFTKWGDRLVKIYRGEIRERTAEGKAGAVVWVGSDFVEVAAGEGSYLIKEVQLEGRKKMTLREFLSGHSISVGTVCSINKTSPHPSPLPVGGEGGVRGESCYSPQ